MMAKTIGNRYANQSYKADRNTHTHIAFNWPTNNFHNGTNEVSAVQCRCTYLVVSVCRRIVELEQFVFLGLSVSSITCIYM